jgi:hypothetical protein
MNRKFGGIVALLVLAIAYAVAGMDNPMVGGKEMYPTKNIIENAVNSADHTTLVAAVQAAGLVETLRGRSRSLHQPMRRSISCPPEPWIPY